MPAFARRAGGMLTDEQIDAIVTGIRARWANPRCDRRRPTCRPMRIAVTGRRAAGSGSSSRRTARRVTARAAGATRRQLDRATASYLALVSDQGLRTTVIAGRPDLGAPDWRGNVPGGRWRTQDIADVVAWLAAQRLRVPRAAVLESLGRTIAFQQAMTATDV